MFGGSFCFASNTNLSVKCDVWGFPLFASNTNLSVKRDVWGFLWFAADIADKLFHLMATFLASSIPLPLLWSISFLERGNIFGGQLAR
jgi:hypothetical protein